jgi:hypothetical protein
MNALALNSVPEPQTPPPGSPASPIILPPAPPVEKPRADSRLKTLPEERQFEIAEYSRAHTLCETVEWLNANGVETSRSALARFLAWYRLREQKTQNDLVAQELIAQIAQQNPDLTPDKLHEIGFIFFSGLALANQDPKTWSLVQRVALQRAIFDLAIEKYHDQKRALETSQNPRSPTKAELDQICKGLHLT